MISEESKARFAREVAKYPADQKQSAVMACLAIAQQELGYVSEESEREIAQYLGMPVMAVHEVTTFYNMYNQPVGKYKLNVCTNLPCQLREGVSTLKYLEKTGHIHGRHDAGRIVYACSKANVWVLVLTLP
jgi:NADH-quinone oxidoreductase subunit E